MPIRRHLLPKVMLPDTSIRNVDIIGDGKVDGFQFKLRNPWYTAQPTSSIVDFVITVDGKKFDPEKITLIIRGQKIPLTKASTMWEISWRFPELIDVFVEKPGGLEIGDHELTCDIAMRETIDYGYPNSRISFPVKKIMKVTK